VIASVESTADTLIGYRQRGEVSENGIKELKIGSWLERMPCGQFKAGLLPYRRRTVRLVQAPCPGGD